jgi:hypothetical protein
LRDPCIALAQITDPAEGITASRFDVRSEVLPARKFLRISHGMAIA